MTFEKDKYRTYLAQLELEPALEDEILDDLWVIAESLVDQSLSSSTYPQQVASNYDAYDAVDQVIAIGSDNTITNKEE